MEILRQLWRDAQSVLRDMSVTQRVAVTFLILTVAVWLTFAAWMGTTPSEVGKRPLPVEVGPAEVNEVLTRLRDKGISSADYDFESRRILVSVDEEKKAVIALAEEGLLKGAHQFGFEAMLDKWAFSDTRLKSEENMRFARSNEVARLIEALDPIKEAQVIYSDEARTSLFGVAHRKSAAVRVKTKIGKVLGEDVANTIIAVVASAKAGLDPLDVVVTDQNGSTFTSATRNGLSAIGKQKWDTEFALNEALRRKLETLIRSYIPNIQFEGEVAAFPKYEVAYDSKEQVDNLVLPGETAHQSTRKYASKSSKRPNEEPGVNANVRRTANLNNYMYYYTEENSVDEKTADKTMQNSVRQIAVKFAPSVTDLSVSAIIQLPYQLKRDAEGKLVQAVNEVGEPLIDPDTRQPMWERESVPLLPQDKVEELKRVIALASGIQVADIPEKIEVSQVPWTAPVHARVGGDSAYVMFYKTVLQNMTAIITLLVFSLVVYILYRYATRPIPTELEEPIEQETMSLAMTRDDEEEAVPDEEWDNLRSKVTAAVQEDPKRAANLLKRWMRKD